MSLKNWLTNSTRKTARRPARLGLEQLEAREVLSTSGFLTSEPAYVVPSQSLVQTVPILTVGDMVERAGGGSYRMVGIPDGMGAFDNGDGTFTLLMNHELPANAGAVRAHGSTGAFVSRYVIDKVTLEVLSGDDLIQSVQLFDPVTQTYFEGTTAFGRLCSADLPEPTAFFNAATGLGTTERIFMNGEEVGPEGRGFGTVVSSGVAYELPRLGKFSWENSVASPFAQDKTVVVGLDDSTPGQVYIYVGTKTDSGSPVDRAGLTNGKLFGVKVEGLPTELRDTPASGRFSLFDKGDVSTQTGAQIDANSRTNLVTDFLRPEDGQWDPNNPNDFYFVTTDRYDQVKDGVGSQVGRSRLYRLRFDDITRPELGGTIEAVLDGTEAGNMYDNMTIDRAGENVLIQEDVGGQAHSGKIWSYNIATDQLTLLAQHNPALFGDLGRAATPPFNNDEESSGIIDVSHILGPGKFIINIQAHYAQPGELVEGGQLLLLQLDSSPLVQSVTINDGADQRSLVTSATVTFNTIVTAPASAFRVTGPNGDVGLNVTLALDATGTRTVARITYTGPNIINGSLANGSYTLTIDGDQVLAADGRAVDADGDGQLGGDHVEEFFRRYGDTDGDGDTDVQILINTQGSPSVSYGGDFGVLIAALNKRQGEAGYVAYLDFNGDGVIDAADLSQYQLNGPVTSVIR